MRYFGAGMVYAYRRQTDKVGPGCFRRHNVAVPIAEVLESVITFSAETVIECHGKSIVICYEPTPLEEYLEMERLLIEGDGIGRPVGLLPGVEIAERKRWSKPPRNYGPERAAKHRGGKDLFR